MRTGPVIPSLLICAFAACASASSSPPPPPLFSWVDGRTVDSTNRIRNVAASIVDVAPNNAGLPVGVLAHCTATLIHERVLLTAGHCVAPPLGEVTGATRVATAESLPPFIRVYVSFSPNALDRSTWIPVAKVAGHPSLLPCSSQGCDWKEHPAPVQGLSDVGLIFLREPVRGIVPARLAPVDALRSPDAMRTPMMIVGYGLLESLPEHKRRDAWDGKRRMRTKHLAQVLDETWATWFLPSELCDGDSGGPIFVGSADRPETLLIVATVSFAGDKCRAASIHPRVDTPKVQQWIRETIERELR